MIYRIVYKARAFLRSLHVGSTALALRQAVGLGIARSLRIRLAKRRHLREIAGACVPKLTEHMTEVHMLLQHDRVYEGMWALYSLAHQSGGAWSIVVHDDGSLTQHDQEQLREVFPSATIIPRATADSIVEGKLQELELPQCRLLRQTTTFALKLFDVILLACRDKVVLLDSDVLFFRQPFEVMLAVQTANQTYLYMEDIDDQYCLRPALITRLVGDSCVRRFNPGLAVVPTHSINLHRVEQYLQRGEFWTESGAPNYYAELTLWAMLMSAVKAKPLPNTYSIAPTAELRSSMVCGHYCGGPSARYLFYTNGIPAVRDALAQARILKL